MFWPFHKWPFSPPPYGIPVAGGAAVSPSMGNAWNMPQGIQHSPFDFLRSHAFPYHQPDFDQGARQWAAGESPRGAMFLPRKAATAYSTAATGAARAVSQSENRLSQLARSALMKQAAGVVMSYEEMQALFAVQTPPVVRPSPPRGAIAAQIQSNGRIPPSTGDQQQVLNRMKLVSALQQSDARRGDQQSVEQVTYANAQSMRRRMLAPALAELARRR